MTKQLTFPRITTKKTKTVVVEETETDKEFTKRIFKTLNEEMKTGALYKCTSFSSNCVCTKCSIYLDKPMKGIPTMNDCSCPLVGIKYLVEHIVQRM